jgi:hypothetical protein
MYNNKYTQYKIQELNNIWVYLFFISFILMQIIEYFIWKNINEPFYNKLFTILATLLLLVQPIASTMLITNKIVRSNLLTLYLVLSIPFSIYRFMTRNIYSSVSPLGHLNWNLLLDKKSKLDNLIMTLWFIFFLFPLFYQGYRYGFLFGFLTLLFIMYNYSKDGTVGSMWCWIVNSIMVFYASYLLLYLPFYK